MSQVLFTQEEIREWEEIELQKRKEDRKQYIERGLSINPRHEKWLQMRVADTRSIAAPNAGELPAVAGNSKPSYLLDSTADPSEAHLRGPNSQGWFISQSVANDGSFQSPKVHRHLSVNACARSDVRTCAEDPEPSVIRAQATNGYSNAEYTCLPRQSPPRDFGIPQSYSASASPPAQGVNPQPAKMSNCTYPSGRQSQKRNASAINSISHVSWSNSHP